MRHVSLLAVALVIGLVGCDSSGTNSESLLEESWNGRYSGEALRIQHKGMSADTQEVDAILFVRFDGERLDSLSLSYTKGALRPEELIEATSDTLVSPLIETSLISATATSQLSIGRSGELVQGKMRRVYRDDDQERWPDSTIVTFSAD